MKAIRIVIGGILVLLATGFILLSLAGVIFFGIGAVLAMLAIDCFNHVCTKVIIRRDYREGVRYA